MTGGQNFAAICNKQASDWLTDYHWLSCVGENRTDTELMQKSIIGKVKTKALKMVLIWQSILIMSSYSNTNLYQTDST